MIDSTDLRSEMPLVRRDILLHGKPVLIERTFGKKTELAGEIGVLEYEKIRGFYLLEVIKDPPSNPDLPGWFVWRGEVKGRSLNVKDFPDWSGEEKKQIGQQYRMANYTFRIAVGDKYIYGDECQWRPLWCQKNKKNDVCAGKLILNGQNIVCSDCGATYPLTMIDGFPRAKEFLNSEETDR